MEQFNHEGLNCYASKRQTVLNSTSMHAKSKYISILTRFSLENEMKNKMLDYFFFTWEQNGPCIHLEI